jgi:hypothetical protein
MSLQADGDGGRPAVLHDGNARALVRARRKLAQRLKTNRWLARLESFIILAALQRHRAKPRDAARDARVLPSTARNKTDAPQQAWHLSTRHVPLAHATRRTLEFVHRAEPIVQASC